MRRKAPMRRRNPERAKRLFEKQYGEEAALVREMKCFVCELDHRRQTTRTEAAHVRSRGAGGTSKDLIPLCTAHHGLLHRLGIKTFEEAFGVNLREGAAAVAAETSRMLAERGLAITEKVVL